MKLNLKDIKSKFGAKPVSVKTDVDGEVKDMKEIRAGIPVKYLFPALVAFAIFLAFAIIVCVFLMNLDKSGVPKANHGIFSVMKSSEKVGTQILDYNDSLWEYMDENLEGTAKALDSFGHHMNPYLEFQTEVSGLDFFSQHGGKLAVQLKFNDSTKLLISQTVTMQFCHPYSENAYKEVVELIDTYLGIKLDEKQVCQNISDLALGSTEMDYGDVHIIFNPHNGGLFSEQHINVEISFFEGVTEG